MGYIKNGILGIICSLLLPINNVKPLDNSITLTNGTYETTYEIGGVSSLGIKMIKGNFDEKAQIEVINDHYYLSITQTSSSLKNLSLNINDNLTGSYIKSNQGEIKTITYALSKENLLKSLDFSVYIDKMKETKTFNITLNKADIKRISDTVNGDFERPGEFVPRLEVFGGNSFEIALEETFILPNAVATFDGKNIDITKEIYFNDKNLSNMIVNNSFTPLEEGKYKVIYRAKTDKYKTSKNNDSYSEFVIMLDVKNDLNKKVISDKLPDNCYLQAGFITSGEVYKDIESKMLDKSVNYRVYSIEFIDNNVKDKLYNIILETEHKDKDLEVYYYDNDEIIAFETDETGIFIVLEPGLQFNMPIWGYILITISAIVVIVGLIIFFVIRHKKHKNIR